MEKVRHFNEKAAWVQIPIVALIVVSILGSILVAQKTYHHLQNKGTVIKPS